MAKKAKYVKTETVPFNNRVSRALRDEANAARLVIGKTWVELIEDTFRATIAVAKMKKKAAKRKEARA